MSLLSPLRWRVSQKVAVLCGSVVCAAPSLRKGIPFVVGALRGGKLPDLPSHLRVLEEPPLIVLPIEGDCEEPSIIVIPLRCTVAMCSLCPAVHRFGPPVIRGRGALSGRWAVEGAAALRTKSPVQSRTAIWELSLPQFLGSCSFFPRVVLPQSL